ncbi:MAG: 5'-nucleotidase C-terminal domain-containing protein [Desulfobulbus sp.]|nr:5'-nucleotidase C-terminal domain-containing protein [Desulfobulbus sp.]
MRRILPLLALCLSSTLVGCGGHDHNGSPQETHPEKPFKLTLLHINDHHSHLDAETVSLNLDTGGKRESVNVERGGFPRVTAAMKELASQSSNVIKMHSGDASTGDLYFTLTEGKADAELMNTVCFDSFTLGNHEFDNTDAGIKKLMSYLHSGSCQTPILSANVHFGKSSPLYKAQPPEAIRPSVIVEKDGQKIGIIGLTVAGKTKHSSRPNADTTFMDEAETAQKEIDRLQGQGVNKIILSTHIGYTMDQALAKKLSGVDVIVGGDSHSLLGPATLSKYGLTPEGPYPTRTTDRDGKPVCITQAWQYGYVVGELKVSFDGKGEVQQCDGTPWLLIGGHLTHKDKTPLNATEKAAVQADIAQSHILRITEPAPAATQLLAPYKQAKESLGAKVVAAATDNLCLRRVPGTQRDTSRSTLGDVCNKNARVNAHGGDIQQIVAEAFLQQGKTFFNADLSLQNGGGVRVDLPPGAITVKDVYTVLPFKNTLVQLNATGQEIKDALEDAVEGVVGPTLNTGCYPYAGGLRWHIDLNQPKGERLSHLEIRSADGSYRPFKLNKTYKVATMSFLADGNDSFTALKNITGDRRIDVGLDYAEAFLQYIESMPGKDKLIKPLPKKEYSTQEFIDTP